MKKKIAILGSTGSIGKSLLKIIKKNKKENFQIILLTANKNYKELLKQTKIFKVKNVIINDKLSFEKFKSINKNKDLNIYNNFNELDKIFKSKLDYTMNSIVGLEGLEPTLQIIKYTKAIAIANKESIICGWNLINKKLIANNTKFIPVDSEHFSIWYAIQNINKSNIDKVFLTASGGPLLNLNKKKIQKVSVKEALKHPTWKMGKKISIDSSTLMNKVFEVIEAKNIFNLNLDKISILIHPKSYIHALISFKDGMIKIIAHETTMDIPILNSLFYERNPNYQNKDIKLKLLNNLNLSKVDTNRFPIISILKKIPQKISLYETVIVSANDQLVRLYLNNEIKYNDISDKLLKFLNLKEFIKLKKVTPSKLSDIINLDKYVRLKIKSKSV